MAENEPSKPEEPVRLTPPPEETEQASEDGLRKLDISADAAIPDGESNKPRIGYRTEYRNRETNAIISEHVHEKDFEPSERSSDEPIFEFVTSYKVSAISSHEKGFHVNVASTQSLPTYHIRVHSIALINAIQSVVRYYPDQDFSGDYITIPSPYPVLVHHYDELQEFQQRHLTQPKEETCLRERNAAEHIEMLLRFLDKEVMESVRAERERNKRGQKTFKWQWVRFKPGTLCIEATELECRAYIVSSVTGGTFTNPPSDWEIFGWSLTYDGESIIRTSRRVTGFLKFGGELPIGDEKRFYDIWSTGKEYLQDEVFQQLVQNGRKYLRIRKGQCQQHNGETAKFPHNKVDGLVMIDLDAYYEAFPSHTPEQQDESDLRNWSTDCACNVCRQQKKDARTSEAVFTKYKNKTLERKMDDMDLALFPAALKAYVFRTRVWELVYVNQLSDPQFDEDMIDNLVMTEQRLATLKALSKSFARVTREGIEMKQAWWSADFVSGKGNGLIFLLHGKPGVGKTCTAECISQFTRRPLMILTSSDIGTDPDDVEENLTRNFLRASRWGAVLLIDEADIFMERRSTSDLTRNSLVAGFLRALEFYDGILFLTTNRVGSFDDAFISRIHVQLYYPDFTDDERQRIWKTFIDKLARERGDTMRLTIDAKEYIESMRKQGIKWNGREIRNAFQTAVALAEYDAEKDSEGRVKVTDNHLRAVVELSKDFKGYLDDLHTRDEGKRARQRMERLDSYEANR